MNGAQRRAALIGRPEDIFDQYFLEVDYGRPEDFFARLAPDIVDRCLARGWGGCVWEFYGGFLRWLHYHGGSAICPGSTIKLEVWAHPYNWTGDNDVAAIGLATTVHKAYQEAVTDYTDEPDMPVLKPVVISHSMGGLVTRAYARNHGGEQAAHGIIHGAMPTNGSPAAYKRMHKGFEGVGQIVLGSNGEEVTAVLANAPGGLELLPNQYHRSVDGGRQWLHVNEFDGSAGYAGEWRSVTSLPTSDPFVEIYANVEDWWRLVNADWTNPGGAMDVGLKSYARCLQITQKFWSELGEYFHPNTRMFYATGHECWDRVNIGGIPEETMPGEPIHYTWTMIENADAPGDGTVHAGAALFAPASVEKTDQHVETGATINFTHESAFAGQAARAQVAFWLEEFVREQLPG